MQITVTTPVHNSFRVKQAAGIFDVPLEDKASRTFELEPPDVRDKTWRIGLIVGPSGSGKSTVAKHLFGADLYQNSDWPADAAVLDGFDKSLQIRDISGLMISVGFSSPPSWIRPYSVLSNGEKFRCDLARALSLAKISGSDDRTIVFDEFTSVVDRNVAKVASAAIAKGLRNGNIRGRFVAVTCHYDVAEWLEPDWILDMATGTLSRRRLRRPEIQLEVVSCKRDTWPLFAHHHYLSNNLASSARCFIALWNQQPVAFCGVLPLICAKNHWRISRLVTLPDFQGLGIGMRFAETLGEMYHEQKKRLNITGSHPAVIAHCKKSPLWRNVAVNNAKSRPRVSSLGAYRGSNGRITVSFEYIGISPGLNNLGLAKHGGLDDNQKTHTD